MNYKFLLKKPNSELRYKIKSLIRNDPFFGVRIQAYKKYEKTYNINCNYLIEPNLTILELACIKKSCQLIIYLLKSYYKTYNNYNNMQFITKSGEKTLLHLFLYKKSTECYNNTDNINNNYYHQLMIVHKLIEINGIDYLFAPDNIGQSAFEYLFKYQNDIKLIKLIVIVYNINISIDIFNKYNYYINYINDCYFDIEHKLLDILRIFGIGRYDVNKIEHKKIVHKIKHINDIKISIDSKFNHDNKFYNNFYIRSNVVYCNHIIYIY